MNDSAYIFDQVTSIFEITCVILFIIAVSCVIYVKVYACEWAGYNKSEKLAMVGRIAIALALGITMCFISNNDRKRSERIWKYGVITVGTTIQKISPGRGEPSIEYRFMVNNHVYTSTDGYTYNGERITGIKEHDGHYRVIYNRIDPTESVMDFKAPVGSSK